VRLEANDPLSSRICATYLQADGRGHAPRRFTWALVTSRSSALDSETARGREHTRLHPVDWTPVQGLVAGAALGPPALLCVLVADHSLGVAAQRRGNRTTLARRRDRCGTFAAPGPLDYQNSIRPATSICTERQAG